MESIFRELVEKVNLDRGFLGGKSRKSVQIRNARTDLELSGGAAGDLVDEPEAAGSGAVGDVGPEGGGMRWDAVRYRFAVGPLPSPRGSEGGGA